MGQSTQQLKPIGSLNVDVAPESMRPTDKRFALNSERLINNQGASMTIGENMGKNTPAHANQLIHFPGQPEGTNTAVGDYPCMKTRETYVFAHNSEGNHHIYRINSDNSTEMVLQDPELNFSLEPRHHFRGRIYLFFRHDFDPQGNKVLRKYLVWTNGRTWQGYLDVETSIATGGFNTAYFNTNKRSQLWELAPRPSLRCVTGEFVPYDPNSTDNTQPNRLSENTWQFRQGFIYTDGRPTTWSPISTTFILDQTACHVDSASSSRAIRLTLDAGGPHVEQVLLAYRNCPGNFTSDDNPEWFLTAIINKYSECLSANTPFYERTIRDDINYDPETNTFEYVFSGEGLCIPIPKKETDRNQNNMPFRSYALAPQNQTLLLMNNDFGFHPVDCDALKKINLEEVVSESVDCQVEMATVKIAVIAHNIMRQNNEPIFVYENPAGDTEGLTKFWGGLCQRQFLASPFDDPGPYFQYFGDKTKDAGWIAYIEGGDGFCVTKQYKYNGSNYQEWIEKDFSSQDHRRGISQDIDEGLYYYISIGEIQVVKGTKGFIRLASHLSEKSASFRDTSTTVYGIFRDRANYRSDVQVEEDNCDLTKKEIYFDTCEGDQDLTMTPFIVADLTGPFANVGTHHSAATAFFGYVRDRAGRPVAGAQVEMFGAQYGGFTGGLTDWNGFYFASELFDDIIIFFNDSSGVEIYGEGVDCSRKLIAKYDMGQGNRPNLALQNDLTADTPENDYENNYIQPLRVLVRDASGAGIPGVSVVVEGNKARITTSDGYASFSLRNIMSNYGAAHSVRIIPMQSGVCYLTMNDCDACMPVYTRALPACFADAETITLNNAFPAFNAPVLQKGWHPGGLYPVAVKFMDDAGRETFAEEIGTIQLSSIQEMQNFSFSRIRWRITGNLNLPHEFVRMSFLIGRNKNFQDFVAWVVDKVEFVDSSGEQASNLGADKILLSIRSLFDAQSLSAFGSNAKYQFAQGDRVEFIANGDGTIFNLPVAALQFPIQGDFNNRDADLESEDDRYSKLVIGYSKDLADLTAGALIKLITPYVCDPQEFLYETCPTIKVVDGEPQDTQGFVNGWDTYFVRRGIRYDDQTHQFSFPFLHHSPSDYWGDHCIDRGRVSVVNPYRQRIRLGRNLVASAAFLENGNYNGLGVFYDSLNKNFTGEQRGDIVGCVSREQFLLMLCEFDWMVINTADGYARVNTAGQLQASNPTDVLTEARGKVSANFGCAYRDVSSILAGDGWVFWIDTVNKMPVICDWQSAVNCAKDQMESYFMQKLRFKAATNTDERPMWAFTGYDPVAKNILITFFRQIGDDDAYVHNRHDYDIEANETLAYCLEDKSFPTSYSFTPEGYALAPGSNWGNMFIVFKGGKPFAHRMLNTVEHNKFFGKTCDEVYTLIVNALPNKNKIFLTMQQQSRHFFYCDRIRTSLGHTSDLPPVYLKKLTEGKYDASFLRKNGVNSSKFYGPPLRGKWMELCLVRDNTDGYKVNTVNPNKRVLYNELDSIFVKFTFSEQSSYNAND